AANGPGTTPVSDRLLLHPLSRVNPLPTPTSLPSHDPPHPYPPPKMVTMTNSHHHANYYLITTYYNPSRQSHLHTHPNVPPEDAETRRRSPAPRRGRRGGGLFPAPRSLSRVPDPTR